MSGQQDVVIGTPVANRGSIEIENLIGLFVNMLVGARGHVGQADCGRSVGAREEAGDYGPSSIRTYRSSKVVELVQPVTESGAQPAIPGDSLTWSGQAGRRAPAAGVGERAATVVATCGVEIRHGNFCTGLGGNASRE